MADLSYSVAVNTKDATQSLDKLKKSAADVGSAFDKLKGAIGGIAFGAVIGNIKDIYGYYFGDSDKVGVN